VTYTLTLRCYWWLTSWILRSNRFSLLDVLIGVRYKYVFIGMSTHICISICIYTVFLKKNHICRGTRSKCRAWVSMYYYVLVTSPIYSRTRSSGAWSSTPASDTGLDLAPSKWTLAMNKNASAAVQCSCIGQHAMHTHVFRRRPGCRMQDSERCVGGWRINALCV
jgi:hypothetical protein